MPQAAPSFGLFLTNPSPNPNPNPNPYRSRLGRDEMWRLLKRVVLPGDPLAEEATQYYT